MSTKFAFIFLAISLSGVAVTEATNEAGFKTNVVKCLSNLRGVNCMVDSVILLKEASNKFTNHVKRICRASSAVRIEINSLRAETKKIIQLNDNVCYNYAFDDDLDGDKVPNSICLVNLVTQMDSLFTKFDVANTVMANFLAATTTSACFKMAMYDFKVALDNFEPRLEFCSSIAAI